MCNLNENYKLDWKALRERLPEDAFDVSPGRVIPMVVHTAIAYGCFAASKYFGAWWQILFLGVVAGHSLTCMGFVAHELSHGMVVRSKRLRVFLEGVFWSTVFVSPTMWKRTHNSTHHKHYGTLGDTDRMFVRGEETRLKKFYARLFYPNAEIFPWNPIVLLYQVPYFTRNTLAAFLSQNVAEKIMPSVPDYREGDGRRVMIDLGVILAIQASFFAVTGFRWDLFIPMAIITQVSSSCLVMSYVFTNHFMHSVRFSPDPLLSSSSVIVPKWMDWLHSCFSYHAEHHVFPTLKSKYYPLLSDLLSEEYPNQYHRVPMLKAWKVLWGNAPFLDGPSKEVEKA